MVAPQPYAIQDGLAVYVVGDGEPVLLMPGPHRFQRPGLRSADALIDGLARLGRRVITFDPPGSGRSTRAARLGMAEMQQCTDEALRVAHVRGAVDAVGHSMGGLTLLGYALDRPARIRRMVLVGTGTGGRAYMNAPGALWNRSHPGFARLALLGSLHLVLRRLGSERMLINFIERKSIVDPRLCRPQPVAPADWLRPAVGRADWQRVARRIDYATRLGDIAAPVLVVCGRHDPQYPPACSEELAAGIHHAELIYFERSGHYPFIEEPPRFWTTVGAFLTGGRACDTATVPADASPQGGPVLGAARPGHDRRTGAGAREPSPLAGGARLHG
jgi:pimeloyl-ACP methyl ester carboxylesterase